MPIHSIRYEPTVDLQDARHLIERLEENMPAGLRGKLTTARELLTEVEDVLADEGCEL